MTDELREKVAAIVYRPYEATYNTLERADRAIAICREHYEAEIARLRMLHEPIPETYSCGKCGRRDGLDCVIPHDLWNRIQADTGHDVLCAWCLDSECALRGWQVRALLAFIGRAISAGTDPQNDDAHWEEHLGKLNANLFHAHEEIARLTQERDELRDGLEWALDTIKIDEEWFRENKPDMWYSLDHNANRLAHERARRVLRKEEDDD